MPIPLPDDWAGVSPSESVDQKAIPDVEDVGIVESIKNFPSALKKAITGQDAFIEFPEYPSLADMESDQVGFFEQILPNLSIFMTRDDAGKAELIGNIYKDDPRLGGLFSDKYGLPMVVWKDIPYYVNKPGLDITDFSTMLGELIKYMPATKYASAAKTTGSTMLRGAGAYSATEAAIKAEEALFTPETTAAKDLSLVDLGSDIGTATALGVTADVLTPPLLKGVGAGAKAVARKASKTAGDVAEKLFPRFDPEIVLSESEYALTVGQRTAEPPVGVTRRTTAALGREDELRHTADTTPGTALIRDFDEGQLTQIRNDALDLQDEFGAGLPGSENIYGNVPSTAAERAQGIVSSRVITLGDDARALYKSVREAATPPKMTREGVIQTAKDLLDVIPKLGIAPSQIVDGPLKREITHLRRLIKIAGNERFKDQALKNLHGYQKRLQNAIGQASDRTEQMALIEMKKAADDAIYNGIERGIITGDKEVLDQLETATGLWADYMGLAGQGSVKRGVGADKQRAANKILERLASKDYTPYEVANLLFGHNRFAPNQSVPLAIEKLKKILPSAEYDEVIALLKDGVLTKAFAGTRGEINRTSIVNNFNDVFVRQRGVTESLFSPEEIKRIAEFRRNVLPTLWAEIKLNPSGTGYTVLGAMQRRGLLNFPLIGPKIGEIAKEGRDFADARDAIRQYIARASTPLLSNVVQAAIRPSIMKESQLELDSFKEEERNNLSQTIEDIGSSLEPEMPPQSEMPPAPAIININPSGASYDSADIFEPLPTSGLPPQPLQNADMFSPTILPSEEDREIAERLAMARSGIGGLMA